MLWDIIIQHMSEVKEIDLHYKKNYINIKSVAQYHSVILYTFIQNNKKAE